MGWGLVQTREQQEGLTLGTGPGAWALDSSPSRNSDPITPEVRTALESTRSSSAELGVGVEAGAKVGAVNGEGKG